MFSFSGKSRPHTLIVGMAGAKMGDHLLQIGCGDGGALAAVAAKVGLSGRAIAVVPDDASAGRARDGAAAEGVLVEVEIAPPTSLPVETATFDLVIVDDARGQFAALDEETQTATAREALRVLKPGGRCLVITSLPATGLAAVLGRGTRGPAFDPTPVLGAGGFRFVRLLGEREGLRFVEGMKPRV
jgi:ubiquinone/menaquinone biosynthesis C-methylase UbiE